MIQDRALLGQVFQGTVHPDANVRNEAEKTLKQMESSDGFLTTLLQWILTSQEHQHLKQAVIIFFKNRVIRSWTVDMSDPHRNKSNTPIGPNDKEFIKQNMVQIIVNVDSKSRGIFAACLNTILASEYPNNWPALLPSIVSLLSSGDNNQIEAGLAALWEVVSLYRYKSAEKRQPLNSVIEQTFPLLLTIANSLVGLLDEWAGKLLHRLFKIYYASMQFELSVFQQDPSSLYPWGTVLMQTIEKEIPLSIMPQDNSERETFSWWKAKKWAFHNIYHLFTKYGLQSQLTKNSKYAAFSKSFLEQIAPGILQAYLKQVQSVANGVWMSNRAKQQVSLLLSDWQVEWIKLMSSVKQKNLWAMIKPHLETIVFHYIFPQLCLTEDDLEQWETDPIEYIQRKMDPMEDFRSSVAAAQGLLSSLVKNRHKHTFLPIVQFINNVLAAYNATPEKDRNPRQKDGAIHFVSCLAGDMLGKKSPMKDQVEDFLATHVLPEFRSPHAYLRARACDVLMKFENAPVNREGDLFQKPEHVQFIFESLLRCLQDTDLPVRVWGALTLREFFSYDTIRQGLEPHAPQVMQTLLTLTNEIDMDTLSNVMESVAHHYPNQLAPYAVQLGAQLRDSFLRIVGEIDFDNEDYDENEEAADRTMAAMGIMKTISTLIMSLDAAVPILLELEKEVAPVVQITLEKNILDLYDDAFEIIDSLTFCIKSISPTMWNFFPLLYRAFKTDAIDYLEEMLPSLDNFVSFGSQVFSTNKEYQRMLFDMVHTIMTNDAGEADYVRACQLAESMLLNLKGAIDEWVPGLLDLAFHHLNHVQNLKTTSFKVHCIELVVNCLLYNPLVTVTYLEQKSATKAFFSLWFGELSNFRRVHDKKLIIFSLIHMIQLLDKGLPPHVVEGMNDIFAIILKTFSDYPEAEAERERVHKLYEGDDDDDDEFDFDEYEQDEDIDDDDDEDDDEQGVEAGDVKDEDDSYLEFLHNKAGDNGFSDDDEDAEWGVCGLEEDPYFITPLDTIDPYICFQDVLSTGIPPAQQQALLMGLSPENKTLLDTIMTEANKKRQAAAEKAQKEALKAQK